MENSESRFEEESHTLRRTMRDLVALSTLPAIWAGGSPDSVVRSLAEVLSKILDLDLIFVRLNDQGKKRRDAGVLLGRSQASWTEEQAESVAQALGRALDAGSHKPAPFTDPLGDTMLQPAVVRFGFAGEYGGLAAAARRPNFPTENERLLLGVGANQAATVLQRLQAEQALHNERSLLSITLASIGDAVITTDKEGRITSLNTVAQSLTGWTQQEASGQPLEDVFSIVNERTRLPVENPVQKVLREGGIVGLANHTVLIAKNGAECPIDDSAAPIRDEQGATVGVVLVFRDVTVQRAAERKLEESEIRYRSLAQATSSIVWTVDRAGRFVAPQTSWSAYTGQTAEQLKDFGWIRALHPEDRAGVREQWEAAVKTETPYVSTGRIWHDASHAYRHFETHGVPIRDNDGSVREWIGTCTDVEDRWRAEAQLLESETRFAQLADAISQLAWMAKPDGHIYWYNNRWYHYTGKSFDEMEGWGWQSVHHPDTVAQVVENWKRSIATGDSFDMVFPIRRADGEFRPFLTRAMPFHDEHGNVVRWFGTNTDITDQQRTQQELREIAARLSEADRRKDEFLAMLAHELRNPLAPIRSGLELMKVITDPAKLETMRGMMERQTQQLIALVDDLLEVSRITQGKLELRMGRVKLSDVVRVAIEAVRPLIDESKHELIVDVAEDDPIHLTADHNRLAQIMSNLLTNAAKYTPPGGRIWLTAERREESATVSVRDTGIGIPADRLQNIFEMFNQIDDPQERDHGGLGIGLALVKSLVEMHGGSITAFSEGAGKGSEFVVRLPVAAESPAQESGEPGLEAAEAKTKRRVLVVDDNKAAAELLGMLVAALGHEVRTAADGREAIETAAEFLPDFVLMDLGMPRMNGYEAAQEIRSQPWGQKMTLVALTGWGQEDHQRNTQAAGFDRHLIKPAGISELQQLFVETKH